MNAKSAIELLIEKEALMDIKFKLPAIAIVLFCSSNQLASAADLKSMIPSAGPKSIVVEGDVRHYDKGIGAGKSCIGSESTVRTRLSYWSSVSDPDLMSAVQSAWLFARYSIAPRFSKHNVPVEDRKYNDPWKSFSPKRQAIFNIGDSESTNVTLRVYPFKVTNPDSNAYECFCLITFHGETGFLFAVYVNVNTGEKDLSFRSASSCLPLVSFESHCPYLTKVEYEIQERLFPREKDAHKEPPKVDLPWPRPVRINQKPVEVDVEI